MSTVRRVMRIMAGDMPDPAARYLARMNRRLEREHRQFTEMMTFVDKIRRREGGADDLPPMPLNFPEIARRRAKEGK